MRKLLVLLMIIALPFVGQAAGSKCDYSVFDGIEKQTDTSGEVSLTYFNSRRMIAVNQLITKQIDRINDPNNADSIILTESISKISFPNLKAYDSPQNVTFVLRDILKIYIELMEKNLSEAKLNIDGQADLDDAINHLEPNIGSIQVWAPKMCPAD